MAPTPGLLYVTMQPKPGLSDSKFNDWYNNEHGPNRLRLPFISNGFRYRATDLDGEGKGLPEWMAVYDVADMAEMTKEPYMRLRDPPVKSQREIDTMKQIDIDRRLYDELRSWEAPGFRKPDDVTEALQENVIVAMRSTVHPGTEKELERWHDEEHHDLVSKVPGWLQSRLFVTSSIDKRGGEAEYLCLHIFAPRNGLGGPEEKAASTTPWCERLITTVVKSNQRRLYKLTYIFGAAPRHLAADLTPFTSHDGQTTVILTSPGGFGAIESSITTKDGVVLPFRLEGSSDPNAPLIVFSNSVLVDWGIWDAFLEHFFSSAQNKKYRVLRYLTRGRLSNFGSRAITLDVLGDDLIALLDALRVQKAAALIGVSLGGATVLSTSLKHRDRVASFVSCDTNSKAPANNSKAWGERVAIAEAESATSASGRKIIGEQLAELTVRRWFVPQSYDGAETEARIVKVKKMVEANDFEGFKAVVRALFEYDLRSDMRTSEVRGAFLVGAEDAALPGVMKEMAAAHGERGGVYIVIPGTGHLPMVEEPQAVAEAVTKFLANQ